MAEDRRDPADAQPDADERPSAPEEGRGALDGRFERSASRPIATRTRVPRSFDAADAGVAVDATSDGDEPTDCEPIYPYTRPPR